ncbi:MULTISPECIES: hypothetical protein [Lactococcus]|uniref:PIL6_22 n=3 Tax=Lactococcus TaxID=1357 RepID=G0WJW1_LACLL|nr:hypothetical protein [Lactococcus lactis]EQC95825.1 hypothetical protein LLT3_00100 [Lactococcus cremoris subsp. cremoris TIFN3]ADX30871.1 PIL6_22 [Lactococcus lactis subsp. lactis]ADZ65004.1 conserved hypothetical protein [Lactococcus lactis subsp. lactis CV56]QQB12901.1 hypothetical protein I6I21_12465 [Lactococcus lactis]RQE21125.1 hypothetical protein D6114_04645 [Lactococcus lactis]
MNNQTLQERKEALIKQQKALIKKRDNINQELKQVKKKIEDSEKDYLIDKLKQSNVSVEEAIELLGLNNRSDNHDE